MLAAVPYQTFPDLPALPLVGVELRTFGLMVALGVLVGVWSGARLAERHGVDRGETYRTGAHLVLAGLVGGWLVWVVTNLDQFDAPADVVGDGGLSFAGGLLAAAALGWARVRHWDRPTRWRVLDAYAMGLVAGLAIARVGSYAVGEHFGRPTGFVLGTRYEGGTVVEDVLGDVALTEGMVFHNTALYEIVHLLLLFGVMSLLVARARRSGREVSPGALVGLFLVWYACLRFATDSLRVNDDRVLSMTAGQWLALVMLPYGLHVLIRQRPELAEMAARRVRAPAGTAAGLLVDDDEDEVIPVPDEVEAPESDEDLSYVADLSGESESDTGR